MRKSTYTISSQYMINSRNFFFPHTLIRQWNVSAITWKCDLHWISTFHIVNRSTESIVARSCCFSTEINIRIWQRNENGNENHDCEIAMFVIFQMEIFHYVWDVLCPFFSWATLFISMALNLDCSRLSLAWCLWSIITLPFAVVFPFHANQMINRIEVAIALSQSQMECLRTNNNNLHRIGIGVLCSLSFINEAFVIDKL